jgi:hypothetical protein
MIEGIYNAAVLHLKFPLFELKLIRLTPGDNPDPYAA